MTKLTLSMDEELIAAAKRIAKRRGQSVSAMFTNLVRTMASQEARQDDDVQPESIVGQLAGSIKLPVGMSADDARYDGMRKKYGLERR